MQIWDENVRKLYNRFLKLFSFIHSWNGCVSMTVCFCFPPNVVFKHITNNLIPLVERLLELRFLPKLVTKLLTAKQFIFTPSLYFRKKAEHLKSISMRKAWKNTRQLDKRQRHWKNLRSFKSKPKILIIKKSERRLLQFSRFEHTDRIDGIRNENIDFYWPSVRCRTSPIRHVVNSKAN